MAPAPPLPVTEDTPPDMLAGSMDLRVVLPGGRAVRMSAERCTPMMDLLVQVTTANKMAPGGYVLQPVGERGVLPYKPSTPIGALDTWTIQIVPKVRTISTSSLKKAPLKPNNQQPFEQTFRLQVHLPRNQLYVTRVSPKSLISDVLNLACSEKNLDPNKYELRHPANLEERLKPEWTLADYKLQEVTLVAKGNCPLGSGLSSSDIMALQKEEEKRRQHVRANGGRGLAVLGLMLGKNSQSSGCDGSISSDSLGGRSISPARSDETPSPPGSSLPPPRPTRKRRPAPKPPTQAAQQQQPTQAVISHSRNSSDSSGYHEASILSESPESNGLSSPSGTLPRRSKLTNSTAQPTTVASTHNLSRSLSNLAHMSNGDRKQGQVMAPIQKNGHSVSTTSLASSGHGKKKKAAPPPPPPVITRSNAPCQLLPEQRTASLSTLSSQSSGDSFDRELYSKSATLERPPSSQSSTTSNNARPESLPEEVIESDEHEPLSDGNKHPYKESNESSETEERSPKLFSEQGIETSLSKEKETKDVDGKEIQNLPKVDEVVQNFQDPLPDKVEEKVVPLSPKTEVITSSPAMCKLEEPSISVASVDRQPKELDTTAYMPTVKPSPRASLPDVVSAKEKPPTPKPRVLPLTSCRNVPPTPRPRVRKSLEKNVEQSLNQSLVSNLTDKDSALGSDEDRSKSPRNSVVVRTHGTFGGTFGVGKTMVMLAASSKDSVSDESYRDSVVSHPLGSDTEMITRFETDNDYEDEDGLNISENDLEMFEIKSVKTDTPPATVVLHDDISLYDSISVASSIFDSEHETSDGTWSRSSLISREFERHHFGTRHSFQLSSTKQPVKLRASSLRSMDVVPSFLEEETNLGRWSSTEDLHDGGKYQETDLQKDTDEIQKAFDSVTNELQAVILAEEAKQMSCISNLPNSKTESPSVSLVDWEYHLPAPPSEFRDTQSPVLATETDNLSEVRAFEEMTPEVLPPAEFIDEEKSPQESESNLSQLILEKECPLIKSLVKGVTKVNPLFSEEKYEAEVRETQTKSDPSSVTEKEVENEEDWSPQQLTVNTDLILETRNRNRAVRSSSASENNNVNQLKNFTISSYQRPCNVDLLTKENNEMLKKDNEFKKPLEPLVRTKQKNSINSVTSNLPRNNSFSAKNTLQADRSVVKRSTSHVSLNNSGRTFRAKSIGNLTMEISREGCGSHVNENNMHDGNEGLRKTTSEANINQDYGRSSRLAELQDQFLQWQEQLLRQTQPDIPLQSLQVLRSILSPSQEGNRDKAKDRRLSEEPSCNNDNLSSFKSRNNENIEVSETSSSVSSEVQLRRQSSNVSNNTKRYSYQGPPAVNFSTWSERPKSQVSIKIDNDYRIGKGQNSSTPSINHKDAQHMENGIDAKDNKITEDEVDSKINPSTLTRSESMTQMNSYKKVEPSALTMRIISHTTPTGYKKASVTSSNVITKSQDVTQHNEKESSSPTHHSVTRVHSYNSAQIADPSRVPIVRAVELKKSFLQGQHNGATSDTKPATTNVKLTWNEMSNQHIRNGNINGSNDDNPEETFQGVNNLAKRFSLTASSSQNNKYNQTAPRPLSAYLYSDSKPRIELDNRKAISNVPNNKEFNGTNNVKKYTSIVGVNGIGSTTSFKESSQEVNRLPPKVTISSASPKVVSTATSKSNNALNSRHPMPVVKGFRFATNDYSDSSLVAADSYKVPQNSQQSVTVNIQQSNTFLNSNQRNSVIVESSPSVSVRIQPASVSKPLPVLSNGNHLVPDAPRAPPLPKKTLPSRPKSFHAPEVNTRDQLMDAIRNFGGRGNLKQNSTSQRKEMVL